MDREKKKIGWNWAAFFFSSVLVFLSKAVCSRRCCNVAAPGAVGCVLWPAGAIYGGLSSVCTSRYAGPGSSGIGLGGPVGRDAAGNPVPGAPACATCCVRADCQPAVFKKRRGTCTRSMSKRLGRANTGSSSLRRVERRCCSASALMCCMTSPICWSSSFWPKFYKIILGGL